MIFLICLFASMITYSQESFKPIIDNKTLQTEAFERTVFFRNFKKDKPDDPIRATGVILKGGYILTNEHVLRPAISGEQSLFHIYVRGKTSIHTFNDLELLGCDKVNDLCLLKSNEAYKDSFWSLATPPFRTITKERPIGLFDNEQIFFLGFCKLFPSMNTIKYLKYTTSAYEGRSSDKRKYDTAAIHFSKMNGEGAACGGDSGGPLFDSNLYLYGIVRDRIQDNEGHFKSYAVPMDIIRTFVESTKPNKPVLKLKTVDSISAVREALKKLSP